jgi:hypothetical protein
MGDNCECLVEIRIKFDSDTQFRHGILIKT